MSDNVRNLALLGGAFFLYRGISIILDDIPDWMREDLEDVDEAMTYEIENAGEIDDLELQSHRIEYKELYRGYYEVIDGDGRDDIPSADDVQDEFDSAGLDLEEEAFGWKAASQGLITVATDEESGFWPDISTEELIVGGLIIGAIMKGEAIVAFSRRAFEWGKKNAQKISDVGTAAFATDDFWDHYFQAPGSVILDGVVEDPVPLLDDAVSDPTGQPLMTVTVNELLNIAPDYLSEFVNVTSGVSTDTVVTVTDHTVDLIADVTGAATDLLMDNLEYVALVVFAIAVAAAIVFGAPAIAAGVGLGAGAKAVGFALGAIGISVGVSELMNREEEVQETAQIEV